jgi:hypothetical protein
LFDPGPYGTFVFDFEPTLAPMEQTNNATFSLKFNGSPIAVTECGTDPEGKLVFFTSGASGTGTVELTILQTDPGLKLINNDLVDPSGPWFFQI